MFKAIEIDNRDDQHQRSGADGLREYDAVHQPEITPRATVRAEHEERNHLDRERNRKRLQKAARIPTPFRTFETQAPRGIVGDQDKAHVEQHFRQPALVHQVDEDERDARCRDTRRLFVDAHLCEIRRKHDHRDQEYRDQKPRIGIGCAADNECDRTGGRRKRPKNRDCAPFGESHGYEPMRRMIAAALRDRTPGNQAEDRHQRRVEDGNQQHKHRSDDN
jgi:hypothetical protein